MQACSAFINLLHRSRTMQVYVTNNFLEHGRVMSSKINISRCTRKPKICICQNKDADQLRSDCEADHRLCFRYKDSTIPFLHKSEISSFWPSSVIVQPGCVGPGRNPNCLFSHAQAHIIYED